MELGVARAKAPREARHDRTLADLVRRRFRFLGMDRHGHHLRAELFPLDGPPHPHPHGLGCGDGPPPIKSKHSNKDSMNIVMLWFQNDWDLFGRRYEMVARAWVAEHPQDNFMVV